MSWATIVAAAAWIIGDAWVSIMTAPILPPWQWWLILVGGGILAALTIVGGILDRRAGERQQKKTDRALDVIAGANVHIIERLQSMTQTSGQPIDKTFEAATKQIEALEGRVAALSEVARHVTRDQYRRFGEAVPKFLTLVRRDDGMYWRDYAGVRILNIYHVESANYAQELMSLFGSAAITVSSGEDNSQEALNTPGLKVLVANLFNPTDNDHKTIALLKAAEIPFDVEERATDMPLITTLRVGPVPR